MRKRGLFFLLILSLLMGCQRNRTALNPETGSELPGEPFITFRELFGNTGPEKVQDFDLAVNLLFLQPLEAYGLYQYDLSSATLKLLFYPGVNDFLAYRDPYLFFAASGDPKFGRFQVENSDTVWFSLENVGGFSTTPLGMDVYGSTLFLLLKKEGAPAQENWLAKFDLGGNLLQLTEYPRQTFYLTAIDGHFFFSIAYNDSGLPILCTFDLKSGSFLPDQSLPSKDITGIRVSGKYFYFSDLEHGYLGRLPLHSLFPGKWTQ